MSDRRRAAVAFLELASLVVAGVLVATLVPQPEAGRVLKVAAITLSGVAAGGAGSLVLVHIRDILHGVEDAIDYAMARTGFAIMVVLIAKLVIRLPDLPPSGDVWWYLLALATAGLGYSRLALRAIFRGKKTGRA